MRIFCFFLFLLFNISQCQCETSTCKTNCTTADECWREAITYRSTELIEQLFSYSSLSVYVDTFQRKHPNEVNDSILFIDQVLENYLSNEIIDNNLTKNIFDQTKQLLIDSCVNLTSTPIEAVDSLPPLTCSLSTCNSERMNFLVILLVSIFIASFIFLICFIQSFQTMRQIKLTKLQQHIRVHVSSFRTSSQSININSNRF